MPKKKIAIAISEWVLDELDEAAEFGHVSRSSLVEEAVTDYVVRRHARRDRERFQSEVSAVLEDMKAFAAEYHADPATANEPNSLEILRALRADGREVGT